MPTPTVINNWRWSDAISRNYWDKYFVENWNANPVTAKVGGGAASGTAGDTNLMMTRDNVWEYNIKGTQTITAPSIVNVSAGVNALNIGMDQTDNDGVEICSGILSGNRFAFLIGTDAAFFFRCQFSIADVSGTDDCAIGFRKAEAYQANIDDYADMAVLNVISGDIFIETILGGAATVSTDTTLNWADGATHELKVLVSSTGVVTYQVDALPPTVVAAYTFTNALYVVPFIFFLNSADLAGAVNFTVMECGYQS